MRIIAGAAKGRRLRAPAGERVRPTGDRVKEAWFSSVAPRLPGASVLDLYSGSGALGLEAASRGAATVVSVERDRDALAVLEANVATTGLAVTVVAADVAAALATPHAIVAAAAPYDLVLADPPYGIAPEVLGPVLAGLPQLLAADAQVWVEANRRTLVPWPDSLVVVRERRYGDTVLHTAEPRPGAS